MQLQNRQSEKEALELELAQKEILLETFLNENEVFKKSKIILQEIKEIKDRLEKLKSKKKLDD
jgi:hypothetical protein